jgi:hypothetical protein
MASLFDSTRGCGNRGLSPDATFPDATFPDATFPDAAIIPTRRISAAIPTSFQRQHQNLLARFAISLGNVAFSVESTFRQ